MHSHADTTPLSLPGLFSADCATNWHAVTRNENVILLTPLGRLRLPDNLRHPRETSTSSSAERLSHGANVGVLALFPMGKGRRSPGAHYVDWRGVTACYAVRRECVEWISTSAKAAHDNVTCGDPGECDDEDHRAAHVVHYNRKHSSEKLLKKCCKPRSNSFPIILILILRRAFSHVLCCRT